MPLDGSNLKTFGGAPFTAAEDNDILEARRLGFTFAEIATLIGTGRGATAIDRRYLKLETRAFDQHDAAQVASRAKPRRCLRCSDVFSSAHAGNRICEVCTERNGHISPFEPG
jgi:hypothetical protein